MFSFTKKNAFPQKRRGAVLVLVLGFVLLLTWLALEILVSVRKELAVKASPVEENKLRESAYQCLEISIAVLAEIQRFEGTIRSPSQGWGVPLTYAGLKDHDKLATFISGDRPQATTSGENNDGVTIAESLLDDLLETVTPAERGYSRPVYRVERAPDENVQGGTQIAELFLAKGIQARVRLIDETGKLSLTATTLERWRLFFEEMDFDESESRILTDSLLDWMDPDDEEREYGAETSTYQQREPPYRAPNRPLRDFNELRLIRGFETLFFEENGIPNEHFATFKNNVSLDHTGEVNLNTASELVLRTLGEESGFDADTVLDFLSGSDLQFGTAQDRVIQPEIEDEDLPKDREGNPIRGNSDIRFITAEIAVSSGQSIFYLNALIDLSQPHAGGLYPFRIVRIAENQSISGT